MPMRVRCLIVIFVMLVVRSIAPAFSRDMDFVLQEKDRRPNFDLYQWIFADGEIVPGTTDGFQAFVRAHPQLTSDAATVVLNSPGGSATEGMRLGDAIRDLHYRTAV